ncbi:MAG: glucosamine-6-phosphate deaminase [Bacteroidota bacterium]
MNPTRTYDASSEVEQIELRRSGRKEIYPPTEKIRVIEVENFPLLGKLTALRFVEWVGKNPGGVVSLPTGKTPEHFIKWVMRILERWTSRGIQAILEEFGIDGSKRPDLGDLSFVQIDEFYPKDSQQQNSFHWYVNEYYMRGLGLPLEKALLIDATNLGVPRGRTMQEVFPNNVVDLSLRVRQSRSDLERLQKEVISRVDIFCMDYETRIREMGGIGFFLGGIGPDGHIAFNVRGSSTYSVTRLTGTNYETQAGAATDLGGIEISRNRLVITIGLGTITYNPTAAAIIIAAGDAKAPVVASAIQEQKAPLYPASVLQDLPHARFYLTKGAARGLVERRAEDFAAKPALDDCDVEEMSVRISLEKQVALTELTRPDFAEDRFGKLLLKTGETHTQLAERARNRILQKIERGLAPIAGTTFLHTEPHHDDIMLGYLAHIYHLVRDPSNHHYFANITSGFTAVSNAHCLSLIRKLQGCLGSGAFEDLLKERYFDPKSISNRMEDVYLFLDGVAAHSEEKKDEAEARRLLRSMFEVYRTTDMRATRLRIQGLHDYFQTQYPGAKDPPDIQMFKGTIREWEVELLWAYFGIEASSIQALRLGFYQGDIFSEEPELDRDVLPLYKLIQKVKPNVVSVAFDPEGSGPDTHYKSLQAIAEALKMYEKKSGDHSLKVWGYRNVWYRFTPSEADLMIPVSLNSLSLLHTAFMNCFGSQAAASFPSYEHDGPFSELAQQIQVSQYQMIKTCLGNDFFLESGHPRLRAARGMIFLKEMELADFYEKVRELKKLTEARE